MMKKTILSLILWSFAIASWAQSSLSHQLWLHSSPVHATASMTPADVAKAELYQAGLDGKVALKLKKSKVKSESYTIYTDKKGTKVVESTTPQGLLYGTYDLLRQLSIGKALAEITADETPAYLLRVLNHWDNPDGTVERGYAGHSIWQWDSLPGTISPRYEEYARACASVGINSVVLNNVNAKPMMLTPEMLEKTKAIADVLRPYGIRVFLSINFASPKALGYLDTADPLDPRVPKWWQGKVAEIYQLIPDFGGFLVKANSEGEPGPGDYGRSHSEGANMLADAVAPYGGTIMWRAFVYKPSSPDRAMQAYDEFVPLDGEFRDNVIIQIKNGPVDFQPREPFSPLFGATPLTQQMVEFQITQEYLGASNHLCYLAPLFKECLDSDTYRGEGTIAKITSTPRHKTTAIAGVANIGDNDNWCGHDFAQANWYAFGRLAWNPDLSADAIADEWLKQTYTDAPEFVETAKSIMMDSREAVVDYMMPIGLHHIFAGDHHYGPEPWYFVPGLRLDWMPIYYHKADEQGIGFDRTLATGSGAVGQYAQPLCDLYENQCPVEYLLWFHHVAWNDTISTGCTLWEELCNRYSIGLEKAREFQRKWDSLQSYVDPERFRAVQSKLRIQTHDAQWWKDAVLQYFQEINHLPFPTDMESPVYDLDMLKQVHIPLKLFGAPSRDQLP